MKIHSIEKSSFVDGPGQRTVVWLQGCPIHCAGCQNQALWPANAGQEIEVGDLARTLSEMARENGGNITITGGEPFAQPLQLAILVSLLKQCYKIENILVYSGYTIEQICQPSHPARPFLAQIFSFIDTLVDGPFIFQLDDPMISHRGSRNQRPIDIQATLQAGGELVLLDWDPIEIVLTTTGDVFMPVGLSTSLGSHLGDKVPQRRCGERTKLHERS